MRARQAHFSILLFICRQGFNFILTLFYFILIKFDFLISFLLFNLKDVQDEKEDFESCYCNRDGVISRFIGFERSSTSFNTSSSLVCPCKANVMEPRCTECKQGFYGLSRVLNDGCMACECKRDGTLNELVSMCDKVSGDCKCKPFAQTMQCAQCSFDFYELSRDELFGCKPCDCLPGSSLPNESCDEQGQCKCLPNIAGKKCDRPLEGYYVPSLHGLKYEAEEGVHVESKRPARYLFDEIAFGEFSWKGYMEMNSELSYVVNVTRAGTFNIIMRYANKNSMPVELVLYLTKLNTNESTSDSEQQTTLVRFFESKDYYIINMQ
jgi:hypothetical protein